MRYAVEAFENGMVRLVADDGTMLTVDAGALPQGAGLGCVLACSDGTFALDLCAQTQRKQKFEELLRQITLP